MSNKKSHLSSPSSTGGLGMHFENRIQTSFVVLMLTNSIAPCLPRWPIRKIKLQGKYQGYDTDDLIIYAKDPDTDKEAKLLGQIKSSVKITNNNEFNKIIQDAWNDFNNPNIFTEGFDIIALICGPLSAADTENVRGLLRQAEHAEDESDFFTRVNLANFTSEGQRNKLGIFKDSLKLANNNVDLSNEQLWRFLKSFRLLIYDLDMDGVTLSLLRSLIGQYTQSDLWAQLNEISEWKNENAGTITIESIPENIQSLFKEPLIREVIPPSLTKTVSQVGEVDWSKAQYASELAIMNLLGSLRERFDTDKGIAGQLAKEDFASWINKLREIIQQPDSPVALKNGRWSVIDRQKLWQTLGSRIYDDQLDIFKLCVVTVLTEIDPQFDMEPKERYAASIYGKVLTHSHDLREGLAETLALFGSCTDALTNCSLNKPETVVYLALQEIFNSADWMLWGSLDRLLPLLAEASPDAFLKAVETAMLQSPCPFDELFSQEGNGVTGGNYLTGLLWALETLAWDEEYLARVSVILGELASHDPGGNWANRPSNSLTTIFLPWLPQTTASIEKRKVAINTLKKENPEEAWKLLLSLLPSQHQISSGSHKPRWRKIIPDDWEKTVTYREYWDQVIPYADMSVEMAKNDISKLNELIRHLDHLTQDSFNKMLKYLSSDEITNKPESQRLRLWEELVDIISRHKKFSDAKWAMKPDIISKIEDIAKILAPKNPLNLYRRLFSSRDFDLYEENVSWEEQQQKLEDHRKRGMKEIFYFGGMKSVIRFTETVEAPWNVGYSLGLMGEIDVDSIVLPDMLQEKNKNLAQFAGGFVWARYRSRGWEWVDKIDTAKWSQSQTGQFLAYLPFTNETWARSEKLLREQEIEYWQKVNVNPYEAKVDLHYAVDKLIIHNRPNSAIHCLNRVLHDKQTLDGKLAVKALLSAVSTKEPTNTLHTHNIIEIIKALQNDPDIDPDDLFKVEWAYLPLLDGHRGVSPKILEQRLISDHNFFCELIRIIFRSDKTEKTEKKPTERQKKIAKNAYSLFREWKTPPGLQSDGRFSEDYFNKWLDSVKNDCRESGHFDVALSSVGETLIHAPSDPNGLWIHKAVAEALNGKDAEAMRNGYRLGLYNSRGGHSVDPTGKPEFEFSAKYNKQAEDVENAGYHRFAATLRSLADTYDLEVKRIIDEFGKGHAG